MIIIAEFHLDKKKPENIECTNIIINERVYKRKALTVSCNKHLHGYLVIEEGLTLSNKI